MSVTNAGHFTAKQALSPLNKPRAFVCSYTRQINATLPKLVSQGQVKDCFVVCSLPTGSSKQLDLPTKFLRLTYKSGVLRLPKPAELFFSYFGYNPLDFDAAFLSVV